MWAGPQHHQPWVRAVAGRDHRRSLLIPWEKLAAWLRGWWQTLMFIRPLVCRGQCWESPQWRTVVQCNEVRQGTAWHRRHGWHRLPRNRVPRCGAGPRMARRRLLHGGAAVQTFEEKHGNQRMRENLRGFCSTFCFYKNSYKNSVFSQ